MKPSKIDAIGFLALVGILAGIYFGFIHTRGNDLRAVKRDVAKLTRVVLDNEGIENALKHDLADLQPVREKLSRSTGRFVDRKKIDDFLRRFMANADEMGVIVSLMKPGDAVTQSAFSHAPITMQLEGAFPGIYALLHGLETCDPLAVIERLQIRNEPGKEKCQVDLTINLYLKPESGA